jgi:hypothetical protein
MRLPNNLLHRLVQSNACRKASRTVPPVANGPVAGWKYGKFRIWFVTAR